MKQRKQYGLETVKNITPLLWANLPKKEKTAKSLLSLKTNITHGNEKHVFLGYARPKNKL